MNNFLFETIRIKKPKRNNFNLSHDVKLSMRMGQLVPIFCTDVVPGDTFKLNTELLIRFAPLIAPVMHRINVYTHYFFVPKRLVWDNWKDFITGGETGNENPSYPRFSLEKSDINLFSTGSLADYLGFPVRDDGVNGDGRFNGASFTFEVDALPFRAYSLIWNEYYRDQNLQDPIDIGTEFDGILTKLHQNFNPELLNLRSRAWTKDYFTSSLPFAQRGNPVSLPLGGTATLSPLSGVDRIYCKTRANGNSVVRSNSGDALLDGALESDAGQLHVAGEQAYISDVNHYLQTSELANSVGVDLSKVSSSTIVELRNAFKAQEFLEAQARGGSRYIEYVRNIFGVKSSDARLQRPEYLGGGKQPVVVSDVMQTSQTTDSSALATPAGAAASLGKTHSFKRYFEEHGYIIGIMSVLPTPAYQQGLPKMFTKFDRYDHYLPQFAHIGEQEVLSKELYFDPSQGEENERVFGYAPRYAEYKFINSSVHGDFRTSLKYWHMGRIFANRPVLNGDFVTSDPTNRIFAVDSETDNLDKLWVNIHHNCTALRPMPKYGTPSI